METTAAPETLLENDQLRVELDDGIAVITLDQQGARVNTIAPETLEALEEAVELVQGDASVRAVVFISGKEDTFVAGADLDALKNMSGPSDAEALSRTAHRLIKRVRGAGTPTVAAIHGAAMGGGLELALGCDYRIATEHPKTKMALPEVQLGLLPGGGGTQFLPRLIGVQQALTYMLTGKTIYPRTAKKIGLVDALIHKPGLLRAAKEAARKLADGEITPDQDDRSFTERLLESNTLSRRLIYQQAGKQAEKETRGNYPAPPKIIECVKTGMEKGLEAGLERESRLFGELAFTPESKALVSIFFAKQKGDKNPLKDQAKTIKKVAVLGAGGLMGAGIAEVSAQKAEHEVLLKDMDLATAAQGRKVIWKDMTKKVKKRALSEFERDLVMERAQPVADYADLAGADLVIEAVPEDLDLKHTVLKDTERHTREDCVFASNTSSLPIKDIAEASTRPETVVGMHYFSPVPNMPLLEIIKTDETAEWALATAIEAGQAQGKTVIVVNDGPGFYTTRILAMYMNEALLLLEEGADVEQVDTFMKDFGFPMGPYELFDLVGIETAAKITQVMDDYLAERDAAGRDLHISNSAATLVKANYLGQKNKAGFYTYEDGKRGNAEKDEVNEGVYAFFDGGDRQTLARQTVQERLSLVMVNEAIRCLDEGILESATDGDLGAVFGLGFPPFRGGPFRHADREGLTNLVTRLERLAETYGDRFAPSGLLRQHAENGTAFHD